MPNEGTFPPQINELAVQLIQTLEQVLPSDGKVPLVAVSVSGGADSCFLARAFAAAQEHRQLDLHILHVNHRQRSRSHEDADFVQELAEDLNLPFHIHRLAEKTRSSNHKPNLQNDLRKKRYRWLSTKALALAGPERIPVLTTGHHAGDQVETILMNLVRGTHLYGLRGIQTWQTLPAPVFDPDSSGEDGQVHLFRPLLNWDRPSIESQLQQLGQEWREDPSNKNTSFLRNRIRHQLVPALQELNGQFVPNLSRQSQEWTFEIESVLCQHKEILSQLDPRLPALSKPSPRIALMDLDKFRELPEWQRRGVLHAALRQVQPGGHGISHQRLERLNASICKAAKTGGPWQWFGSTAWSFWNRQSKREMGLQPVSRIISLHRQGSIPFPLNVPLLRSRDWKSTLRPNQDNLLCWLPASDPDLRWVLRMTRMQQGIPNRSLKPSMPSWEALISQEMWQQAGLATLAAPQPTRRMQPIGMHGHSKSLRSTLRDRKIHRSLQDVWPTLYTESGEPFWLCGLQLDQRFTPQSQPGQAIRLVWQQEAAALQDCTHDIS